MVPTAVNEPFFETDIDPSRILFVGQGNSPVVYYRCMLPAHSLGCDYVGVLGAPGSLRFATGLCRINGGPPVSAIPEFSDYDVVILQQVHGEAWLEEIARLRVLGVTVIYEVDDHLWGVSEHADHDWSQAYHEQLLGEIEACMLSCDAVLTSTAYLREEIVARLGAAAPPVYVARNGIDPARYAYTKVPHPTAVTIGWAGATGHRDAAAPWIEEVIRVMNAVPEAAFLSIGEPLAREVVRRTSVERGLALPWMAIEQYPAAMTMMDIALAPGGETHFQRSKSDLRWLEASLAGAATIAHPGIYHEIIDGRTGLHASADHVAEKIESLIRWPEKRLEIASNARAHVLRHRTMESMRIGWEHAIEEAVG